MTKAASSLWRTDLPIPTWLPNFKGAFITTIPYTGVVLIHAPANLWAPAKLHLPNGMCSDKASNPYNWTTTISFSFTTYRKRFHAMPNNLKGAATIMVAAAGFAAMVALVKLAGERLHVTQVLFVRQIIMVAIVSPSVLSQFPGCLKTERLGLHFTRVAFALVAMLCGFTAVIKMPLADVTALGFAKSFFTTIFAVWLLNEVVGWRRWMAVAFGFAGVLVMMRPGLSTFDPYSVYAVIGAAAAGMVMIIIRILSRTEAPVTILSYQAFLVGFCVAIPAILNWTWPTAWEWMLLAAIGLVSYGSQMMNIYAYKWGEASLLASLDYVRLLWATLFGALLFGTLPTIYTLVGAGVIIAASIYTVHRERVRGAALARSPHGRGKTNI